MRQDDPWRCVRRFDGSLPLGQRSESCHRRGNTHPSSSNGLEPPYRIEPETWTDTDLPHWQLVSAMVRPEIFPSKVFANPRSHLEQWYHHIQSPLRDLFPSRPLLRSNLSHQHNHDLDLRRARRLPHRRHPPFAADPRRSGTRQRQCQQPLQPRPQFELGRF